jgi:hypothetical protein
MSSILPEREGDPTIPEAVIMEEIRAILIVATDCAITGAL